MPVPYSWDYRDLKIKKRRGQYTYLQAGSPFAVIPDLIGNPFLIFLASSKADQHSDERLLPANCRASEEKTLKNQRMALTEDMENEKQ